MFNIRYEVVFNRPIDPDRDFISPGSYTILTQGKEITFDFFETCAFITDCPNNDTLYVSQKCLDTTSFPESEEITNNMLKTIESFPEFFICCEPREESDKDWQELKPIKVNFFGFITLEDDIYVPNTILKKVKFGWK